MENKRIIETIQKNKKENYLFNNQNAKDLSELYDYIKAKKYDQIAIKITLEDWLLYSKLIRTTNYEETLKRCDQFISLKIAETLNNKNKRLDALNASEKLQVFKRNDEEKYEEIKEELLTTKELNRFIELENIRISRIHFIIEQVPSVILADTLIPLLGSEKTYSVSIYVCPEKFISDTIPNINELHYINEVYDYTEFNKDELVSEYNHSKRKIKNINEKVQKNIYRNN